MPNYVGYSPWTDAGNYGAGLGATLGKALIEQPQMRYQLALQQQQMAQRQQQQIAQQAYQQGQLGMSKQELDLHRQELVQNDQQHQLELQRLQKQTELEQKGTWKFGESKSGVPYRMNTITGETVPLDGVFQQSGTNQPPGLGQLPITAPQLNYQSGLNKDVSGLIGHYGKVAADPASVTNNPYMYNQATNFLSQAAPFILHQLGQGLGSNPPMPATNSLGMATNAPQRVLRFDPSTGTLQ